MIGDVISMYTAVIVIVIIAYMAMMIYIGAHFSKKNASTGDFYLGGRRLGPFVTAMSAEASDMSSYLLMGVPGVALAGLVGANGTFAEVLWTVIGLAAGTYINWLLVARRLRVYSEEVKAYTIPDFFANRFGDKAGMVLVAAAVIIIIFFVPYTASGFASVGKLFNTLFGWDYHMSMIIGAIIIATYTILGGFLAASHTDFIQSIVMTFALLIVLGICLSTAGGMGGAAEHAESAVNGYFSLSSPDHSYGPITIMSILSWGLGYFGMPHILLRFMGIRSHKELTLSRRIATVWVVIAMGIAVIIGVAGYAFVKAHGFVGTEGFDPERIIIYVAATISKINPAVAIVGGIILAGILASIMSTSDSQMLAASSSVSENVVAKYIAKGMSEKKKMLVARITVLAIAIIAIIFAWDQNSSVFRIVSFAWAGFGAAFGPLMLFCLFWKRTTKWGAFCGIIAGGAMIFIWKFGIATLGGAFAIYELMPSFIVSCIVIVVVSLATGKPEKEIEEQFEEVKRKLAAE